MLQVNVSGTERKVTAPVHAFDYAAVAPELASNLRSQAALIKERMRATTSAIIETGLAVKQSLEHGQFCVWVPTECGFSTRTAQRYMSAAEFAESKNDTVSLLSPTCLYLLAAKSTPTSVVTEVISRIESGENVLDDDIRMMLGEARYARREITAKARLEWRKAKLSPRTLRRREAEERKNQEAREKRQRDEDAAIKAKATVLVERHGSKSAQAFAQSLLSIPEYELRDVLRHLVEFDVAQHVDGGAP
jgi:hypothetical protein